jgi:hypothetical protein
MIGEAIVAGGAESGQSYGQTRGFRDFRENVGGGY